ncbi:type II toxin-antitoxin system Phd/YefM family antitoxin [Paenibacillus sanguinis]|uniref:type II toxin-antitoxin system Phd/YefM family antitoxin n=1 Tax=Paenibacillus sanguinis TaxID=225906 RepID=UPI000368E202|nr:type II toxin-antitoxin system Phd/YefM family antitoxin [Paenibacillus sanguinis]
MQVTSTDMQNNFGKYLKFAEAREEIIITRNGKAVATLKALSDSDPDLLQKKASAYATSYTRVSHEEFLELSEASDQRFELIDGILYNLASPSFQHQHAVHELHGAFYGWFKGKPCTPLTAPFDVTLQKSVGNTCVVQPDLVVICDKEHMDEHGKYQGIPKLVVEVLSPSTRSRDVIQKLDLYRACGIQEYWVVDPMKQQITVYIFRDKEIADICYYTNAADSFAASQVFDGLHISMSDFICLSSH